MTTSIATSIPSTPLTGNRVLCIGCGGAVMTRDAIAMAEAMRAVGHRDVELLTGGAASEEHMKAMVKNLLDGTSADQTIILFCSCHANYHPDGTLWLLPDGSSPKTPGGVGLNVSDLRKACLTNAANLLVILDCCYAGALATNNLGKLSRKWRTGPGRVFITSCSADDVTHYRKGTRYSALTSAILKYLSRNKTRGSVRELALQVKDYFAERPYWGRSICIEERGDDFLLCNFDGSMANETNETTTGLGESDKK